MQPPAQHLLVIALILLQTSCSVLPHEAKSTPAESSPVKKQFHLFPPPSLRFLLFHHPKQPLRAQALQQVGVIRTLSNDGSFVIIELEPGVMIPPGRDLIVTANAGEPIRLRSAENQPPYFIADVKMGHPTPGQIVFQ